MCYKRLCFLLGLIAAMVAPVRATQYLPDDTPVYLIDAAVDESKVNTFNCPIIPYLNFKSGSANNEAFKTFTTLNTYLLSKYGATNTTKIIVYVNAGNYSGGTISVPNVEFRGANSFRGWEKTAESKVFKAKMDRVDESIITGILTIDCQSNLVNPDNEQNAFNITLNGFNITGAGQIRLTGGTTKNPQSGFKFLYNKITASTLVNTAGEQGKQSTPVILIGGYNPDDAGASSGTANVLQDDRHRRYANIEFTHNYFDGTGSTQPVYLGINNAYEKVRIHDNYFNGGGSSIMFQSSQGDIEITNNRFNSVTDGYCVYLYHCAKSHFTNLNVESNEFIACQGLSPINTLIRINQGDANKVTPVELDVNVRYNLITGKTALSTATANEGSEQLGENIVFYCDPDDGCENIDFDVADNHCDNRFYKFCNVKLRDGLGVRDVFASVYACFTLTRHDGSTYRYSMFNNNPYHTTIEGENAAADADNNIINMNHLTTYSQDASLHLVGRDLSSGSVMQSFDIDALTADIYTSQVANDAAKATFLTTHGLTDDYLVLDLNRIVCTTKATTDHTGGKHIYAPENELMRISKAGQGTKLSLVRDSDGQLWVMTGADGRPTGLNPKNGTSLTNDIAGNYIALFKWVPNGELVLDPTNPPADVIFVKHPEATGTDDYLDAQVAVDEINRYICFASLECDATAANPQTIRTYCFYDLDEFLNRYVHGTTTEKLRLLKKLTFKEEDKETTRDAADVYSDEGFETWPVQSFAICGDYLFVLEGTDQDKNDGLPEIQWVQHLTWQGWAQVNTSRIMMSTINWRSGVFFKRERILEPLIGGGQLVDAGTKGAYEITSVEYKKDADGNVTYPAGPTTYASVVYCKPEGITVRPNVFGHVDFYLGIATGDDGARKANVYKYYIDRVVREGTEMGSDLCPYTRHTDERDDPDPLKPTNWLYPGIYMKMVGFAKDEKGDDGTGYYQLATKNTPTKSRTDFQWSPVSAGATYNVATEYRVRMDSKQGLHFEGWDVNHQPELTLGLGKNTGVYTNVASDVLARDPEYYAGTRYNHSYTYGAWTATIIGEHGHLFSVDIEENDRFSGDITTSHDDSDTYTNVKVKFNGYAAPVGHDALNYNAYLRLSSPGANDLVIPIQASARNIPTGVANVNGGNENYPVEWYNIQGMRMTDGVRLAPGVYIRRQGTDVKKVYIQ